MRAAAASPSARWARVSSSPTWTAEPGEGVVEQGPQAVGARQRRAGIRLPPLVERDARRRDVHDARSSSSRRGPPPRRAPAPARALAPGLVPGALPRREERELRLRDVDTPPRRRWPAPSSTAAARSARARSAAPSSAWAMPRTSSAAGSPVASRGEQLERPLRVRERALDAVRHHGRAQSGDPGLDRGAAVRERDGRGGPIGEREPSLGLGRPPGQRAHPGAEDGERGEPHQVVVVEPPEPLLEGLHAPAVVERQGEPVDQPGDGGRLARGLAVEDRRLRQVVGHAPGHRAGVERRPPSRARGARARCAAARRTGGGSGTTRLAGRAARRSCSSARATRASPRTASSRAPRRRARRTSSRAPTCA